MRKGGIAEVDMEYNKSEDDDKAVDETGPGGKVFSGTAPASKSITITDSMIQSSASLHVVLPDAQEGDKRDSEVHHDQIELKDAFSLETTPLSAEAGRVDMPPDVCGRPQTGPASDSKHDAPTIPPAASKRGSSTVAPKRHPLESLGAESRVPTKPACATATPLGNMRVGSPELYFLSAILSASNPTTPRTLMLPIRGSIASHTPSRASQKTSAVTPRESYQKNSRPSNRALFDAPPRLTFKRIQRVAPVGQGFSPLLSISFQKKDFAGYAASFTPTKEFNFFSAKSEEQDSDSDFSNVCAPVASGPPVRGARISSHQASRGRNPWWQEVFCCGYDCQKPALMEAPFRVEA